DVQAETGWQAGHHSARYSLRQARRAAGQRTRGQGMIYQILNFVHVLSVVIWVGGMFFAHFAMRPAATGLEANVRIPFMIDALRRFFGVVLVAAPVAVLSGLWMIGRVVHQASAAGGHFSMPLGWTTMATLGIIMLLLFGHIRFALYRRLQRAGQA